MQVKGLGSVVKTGKQGLLLSGQNIELGQRNGVVAQHGIRKGTQALCHAADGFAGKELCAVFEVHVIAAVGPLTKIKTQVKLAALVGQVKSLHAQRFTAKVAPAGVFQRGKNIKQRVLRGVSFNPNGLNDLFKGAALGGQGVAKRRIHRAGQFGKTGLRIHARPHHKRVYKQTHKALNLLVLSVGRRATHNNVVLPGVAQQKGIHQSQQDRKHSNPRMPRPVFKGKAALKPQIKGQHRALKALHRRTGEIERQPQTLWQRHKVVAHLRKHVWLALRIPQRVTGKIQLQRPPLRGHTLQHGGIGLVELAGKNFCRPAVKNNVVEAEQQYMAAILLRVQSHAGQRSFRAQGHGYAQIDIVCVGRVVAFEPQAAHRGQALLWRVQRHAQAQGIVAFFKQGQGLLQGHGVHRAAQPCGKRNHIDLTALVQLLHKPDALLRGRQRIGCPPRHARNNSLWRDQTRNAGREGAGAGVAHDILNAHSNIKTFAQARKQAHGHKAVPAKLKEIRIHRIHGAAQHGGISLAHGFCQRCGILPEHKRLCLKQGGFGLGGGGGSGRNRVWTVKNVPGPNSPARNNPTPDNL